ncbi:hypothetical protein [Paenibacillus periandrae]|uniref:hypothetical protein n=1 Tax=Paenibacillus periandrae TaxID=1761741 RepID=UPI001F088D38|nr:hypothetical protein [Paenibacillus periandrae]
MNEEIVYKPIILGEDGATGEYITWPWFEEQHSTMTIIGSLNNSPRLKLVDRIINEIQSQNTNIVFRISNSNKVSGVSVDSDAILWTEKIPDPSEEFEDRDIFIENRRTFSTSYFNLFAMSKGIKRSELLPNTSYRWHMEGPLNGYQRIIENLDDDHPYKLDLMHELEKISIVPWYKSKENGAVFQLDQSSKVVNKALSFLRAVWSFWSIIGMLDDEKKILLTIDVPPEILDFKLEKDIAEVVSFSFDILRYLAYETTVALLISSDMMYPAPEKEIRHKIIFNSSEVTDFDLNSEDIKPGIDPFLFEMWGKGEQTAGIHFDDIIGSQTILIPRID